jgi:hypothetical protein
LPQRAVPSPRLLTLLPWPRRSFASFSSSRTMRNGRDSKTYPASTSLRQHRWRAIRGKFVTSHHSFDSSPIRNSVTSHHRSERTLFSAPLRLQDGSSSKLHHAARGICRGDCWGGHNRLEDASKEESCKAHVSVGEAQSAADSRGQARTCMHLHALH